MTEQGKAKRDELAEDVAQFCTCTGIVCHGCEKSNKSNFIKGFDAGYAEAEARIKQLEAENAELKKKVEFHEKHPFESFLEMVKEGDTISIPKSEKFNG